MPRRPRQGLILLSLISDSEFQEGQSALERAAADERTPVPVMEVIDRGSHAIQFV